MAGIQIWLSFLFLETLKNNNLHFLCVTDAATSFGTRYFQAAHCRLEDKRKVFIRGSWKFLFYVCPPSGQNC